MIDEPVCMCVCVYVCLANCESISLGRLTTKTLLAGHWDNQHAHTHVAASKSP